MLCPAKMFLKVSLNLGSPLWLLYLTKNLHSIDILLILKYVLCILCSLKLASEPKNLSWFLKKYVKVTWGQYPPKLEEFKQNMIKGRTGKAEQPKNYISNLFWPILHQISENLLKPNLEKKKTVPIPEVDDFDDQVCSTVKSPCSLGKYLKCPRGSR